MRLEQYCSLDGEGSKVAAVLEESETAFIGARSGTGQRTPAREDGVAQQAHQRTQWLRCRPGPLKRSLMGSHAAPLQLDLPPIPPVELQLGPR